MFVMTGDGGSRKVKGLGVARTLIQRLFLFDLLHRGMAVTYLHTCEFRDSKVDFSTGLFFTQTSIDNLLLQSQISSHVYEQRLDLEAVKLFPEHFWETATLAQTQLDEEQRRHDIRGSSVQKPDWRSCIESTVSYFLSSQSLPEFYPELLFVFVVHSVLLQEVSVYERALPVQALHPDLNRILLKKYLPDLFLVMSDIVSSTRVFLDIDVKLFASLIRCITGESTDSIARLVGRDAAACTTKIWSSLNAPQPDFQSFAARFPAPASTAVAVLSKKAKPIHILPFDNEVFNLELSTVHIVADAEDDEDLLPTSPTHLDFGRGILFSDTQHWHNHKRAIIKVKGKAAKPVDKRLQKRLLRSDQRFMANLQQQAGTLTGALGAVLQRTVILPAGAATKAPAAVKV